MKLYFIHRNLGIRRRLEQVMPRSQWEVRQPTHLKSAKASDVVTELAARLLAYLREQPEQVEKVSSKEVKAALKVADDEGTKKAFTRAAKHVTQHRDCGWALAGRSLVRTGFAYHFGRDPS